MLDSKAETIATYERGAQGYSAMYESRKPRTDEVDQAFSFSNMENPFVVEIGSGVGKEAAYILEKIPPQNYIGLDVSKEILKIARNRVPHAKFIHADIVDFDFPVGVDIVFAFASLLHSSKEEIANILKRVHVSLNERGVVYLTLKKRDQYQVQELEDQFGLRHFFYYTRDDILEAAGEEFEEIYYAEQKLKEDWFMMALRKK